MAEVRKKVVEDKYNTASLKKNSKSTIKSKGGSTKRSSGKNNEKKSLYERFRIFCHGVKSEFNKVHWTSKKDMVKYSVATIITIIFCAVFFYVIDVLFALIQSLLS